MEQSGAGRRTDLSGRDIKKHEQRSYYKSIKGPSIEFIIAAALGLELHHPIMSKLWGLGYQTYRQTCVIGFSSTLFIIHEDLDVMV